MRCKHCHQPIHKSNGKWIHNYSLHKCYTFHNGWSEPRPTEAEPEEEEK